MKRIYESVSKGLLLVTIGVLFLLMNFGMLSWGFWLNVVDLWPLVLILVGIGLVVGRRVPLSAILLIFLVILAGYALTFGQRSLPERLPNAAPFQDRLQASGSVPVEVPLSNGVDKVELQMNLGGAQVDIHPLPPTAKAQALIAGTYGWESAFGVDQPGVSYQRTGNTMSVSLSSPRREGFKDNLNLGLSGKVKYSVTINSGAISGNLDFSQIPLEQFTLNSGASKYRLVFGDTGSTLQGRIDSGASDITLAVPANVGLRVHVSGVLGSTNFMGSGMFFGDKDWVSPGYEQARTKIDLNISTAAGSVHLERPTASSGSTL